MFKGALGLRDATAVDIVHELARLRPDAADIPQVRDLMFWLSDYLHQGNDLDTESISQLETCVVFPVFQVIDGQKQTWFVAFFDLWYIADRPSLRQAFQTKVPLLDFAICEFQRIRPLLTRLGLDECTLSASVDETAMHEGDAAFHGLLTEKLIQKLTFMER